MFFDLDGTLHQQDMFGSFLRYLLRHLPLNLLLVVAMGPVILAGLAVSGRAARWPMSLLLWATTFGRREAVLKRLEAEFVGWLITGSPQSLVEQVYRDTLWLPRVNLIASRTARRWGGWVLTLRCLGHEKVVQLEKKIGAPLRLYSGYSDSEQDNPLLGFCQHRWRVTPQGELQQLE
ncbi:MAG: phosphatidylglycerophosphatase C [Klebsiella pneumoniae]|nr:phosphatidylglycerophosphatase C [Klebsiella pneumoniae]